AGLPPDLAPELLLLRARGPVNLSDLARHARKSEGTLREMLSPAVERGDVAVGRFTEREPGNLDLELCDASTLAHLRRRALSRARRLVEPVPLRAFQRWLL